MGKKLKYWKKGAIFGAIAGLILIIIILIIDAPNIDRFPEFLFLMLILYILLPILLGTIIGFFSSRIKNKFIFWGGIIGLIVGLFSILLFETKIGRLFLYPIVFLNQLILHIPREADVAAGVIAISFHIPLWILIGIIAGFIVYLINRKIFGRREK